VTTSRARPQRRRDLAAVVPPGGGGEELPVEYVVTCAACGMAHTAVEWDGAVTFVECWGGDRRRGM
jgi:hypothetical protein